MSATGNKEDNFKKVNDSDSAESGASKSESGKGGGILAYLSMIWTYWGDNLPIILVHNNDVLDDQAF